MSPEEQMIYSNLMVKLWNTDVETYSKRFKFLPDRITDEEHVVPKVINLQRMNYTGKQIFAPKIADTLRKYKAIEKSLKYIQNNFSKIVKKKTCFS